MNKALNSTTNRKDARHDREADHLKCFAEFTELLDTCRTVQAVLELALEYTLLASQADEATIYFSEQGGALQFRCGKTADGKAIKGEAWEDLESFGDLAQHSDRPLMITGAASGDQAKLGAFLTQRGILALMTLPITPEASTLIAGIILLRYVTPHKFSLREQQLLVLYAAHIRRAIEHVHLMEEFRQRDVDMHIVVDTVHMMISTLEMEELLRQVAVRLAWVSGMEDCAIAAYETDPDRLRMLAHYHVLGVSTTDDVGKEYLLANHTLLATILWAQQPTTVRLGDPDIDPMHVAAMQQKGYDMIIALPLKAAGQPIGLIELYGHSASSEEIVNTDMRRLRLLSEQVALALVNARLYQSECEQRALAEALRKISLALSSSLKASALLEVLLDQLANVVPYDSVSVMLVEGEHVRIAVQRGYENWGHPLPPDFILRLDDVQNLQSMAASRCSMVIADIAAYPDWAKMGLAHIRSWVGAPLVVRDQLLGFLSLDKVERNFYGPEHAARLEMLAGHAAIALWNALTFGEVEQASITDFLTGAYNHRYFQQQLRTEMERSNQYHQPLSLLMIDIDHFKKVNDRYGHLCGDQVLRQLTARLHGELRGVDFLARYGGEEFAILLPGTSSRSLIAVGQRLIQVVNSQPFVADGREIPITISLGGAAYPEHANEVQKLIALADQALYQAKNTGRNRFCMTGG